MIMNVKLVFPNGHERTADLPILPRVGETMVFTPYEGDDPGGDELVLQVREVRHALRSYLGTMGVSYFDEVVVFLVNPGVTT